MGLEGTIGGSKIHQSADNYKISVSQAARLHSGSVKIEGIISGISKLKKIIKSQDYECGECGNIMKFVPTIEFENQKHDLADDRPYLYQPLMKTPDRCSNANCESNKHNRHLHNHFLPRREYINAIVIELRDLETFSDIDPLKVVLFDDDTKDVHAHLGQKVTIIGNIHVITFPRKDTVSYLYAETITYESSQEVIIRGRP